jgi:hypothetical protein
VSAALTLAASWLEIQGKSCHMTKVTLALASFRYFCISIAADTHPLEWLGMLNSDSMVLIRDGRIHSTDNETIGNAQE